MKADADLLNEALAQSPNRDSSHSYRYDFRGHIKEEIVKLKSVLASQLYHKSFD